MRDKPSEINEIELQMRDKPSEINEIRRQMRDKTNRNHDTSTIRDAE